MSWVFIAIGFGIYIISSTVLRIFPHILHSKDIKRRQSNSLHAKHGMHHISHRGGAGENLENTMKAFDHAYACKTNMFEIDCHLTKDGKVVVAHDNHLLRLCGEDIYISETAFADLPPLLSTQRLDFNHRIVLTKDVSEDERRILSLEELFVKYPRMPMNIDLKTANPLLHASVEKLIVKYNRCHLTIWGNSSDSINQQVRILNGQISTLHSMREVLMTIILYYSGLLPFMSIYADFFEIPMFSVILDHRESFPSRTKTVALRTLMQLGDLLVKNRKFVEYLKARGVPTYFFVLNSEHEWQQAVDLGASGIMTDFPAELRQWMDNHNQN